MEGSLEEIYSKHVEHAFLYKEFERICPQYISIGMTYEQFWYEDVCMVKAYRKAFELKERREAVKNKWTIWEQGLYIYEALCDVSPILRAFSKATKPLQYSEKPYEIDKYTNLYLGEVERQNTIEEEEKKLKIIQTQIYFENWAKATQKRFEEKGG